MAVSSLSICNEYYHSKPIRTFKGSPRPLGPGEIDGLLVPPGKAFSLLTDYLITG